jgi:hypothetical protein
VLNNVLLRCTPALPAEKQQALRLLNYGSVLGPDFAWLYLRWLS